MCKRAASRYPSRMCRGAFLGAGALSDSRTGLPGVSVQSWVCGEGIVSMARRRQGRVPGPRVEGGGDAGYGRGFRGQLTQILPGMGCARLVASWGGGLLWQPRQREAAREVSS